MTSVVICSKCRKLSLVPNTSTVFATCNLKFVQNFVLQAKKTNKHCRGQGKLTSTARSIEPIGLSTEMVAVH